MTMEVADKSVDTDELCYPTGPNTCLEVARLEAVLNSLVEHKVEAIKNDGVVGAHLSPKTLAKRLRLKSTTSTSSAKENKGGSSNRKHRRKRKGDDGEGRRGVKSRRTAGRSKQRVSSSSPESARYGLGERMQGIGMAPGCERTPPLSDDDAFLHYDPAATSCCCGEDVIEVRINPMQVGYDEDYVSLKIEEDEDEEEARRRARRKRRRRRRRRRRMKAMSAVAVVEEVKVLDPDELPQRARWTIVATACLLLFMCLMLVGVTLRMAPLIDDMVRKENEELMHSLHGHHVSLQNSSPSIP